MGTPPEMDVYFHAVGDATTRLREYQRDERAGILLTGTLQAMLRLVREAGVREVNIGGLHHQAGRRQRLRYVFLAPEEEQLLREMAAAGAVITAQDVPAAAPVPLQELLSAEASVE